MYGFFSFFCFFAGGGTAAPTSPEYPDVDACPCRGMSFEPDVCGPTPSPPPGGPRFFSRRLRKDGRKRSQFSSASLGSFISSRLIMSSCARRRNRISFERSEKGRRGKGRTLMW